MYTDIRYLIERQVKYHVTSQFQSKSSYRGCDVRAKDLTEARVRVFFSSNHMDIAYVFTLT